jgi:hypothetical protein
LGTAWLVRLLLAVPGGLQLDQHPSALAGKSTHDMPTAIGEWIGASPAAAKGDRSPSSLDPTGGFAPFGNRTQLKTRPLRVPVEPAFFGAKVGDITPYATDRTIIIWCFEFIAAKVTIQPVHG